GHDVEEISQRSLAQPLDVVRRRLAGKSARGDETVAVAQLRVTRRAVDVEAILPTRQNLLGSGKGQEVAGCVANLAAVKISVFAELSSGDRSFHWRPCRALIGIEIAAGQRFETWLVLHVEAASAQHGEHSKQRQCANDAHRLSWAPRQWSGDSSSP